MKTTTTVTVTTAGEEWFLYNGWMYRLQGSAEQYVWRLYMLDEKFQPVTFRPYIQDEEYTLVNGFTDRALQRRAKRKIRNKQSYRDLSSRKKP